jgi:hypothetical protein
MDKEEKPINPRSAMKKARTGVKKTLEENELFERFFQTLRARAIQQGLTCGKIADNCGPAWRRGLAKKQKLKKEEATATDVQAFVYDRWKAGQILVEPPSKGQKACRVWPVEVARAKFPYAFAPAGYGPMELTEQSLKSAYEKLVPEYIGGFVPIYRVRRDLQASRPAFDKLLRNLNERPDPVIELFPSDPRDVTADQKEDCLMRGDTLLVRMKWR